jgi:hypothetical protein
MLYASALSQVNSTVRYVVPSSKVSKRISRFMLVFLVLESENAGSTPIVFIAVSPYFSLGKGTYTTLLITVKLSKHLLVNLVALGH